MTKTEKLKSFKEHIRTIEEGIYGSEDTEIIEEGLLSTAALGALVIKIRSKSLELSRETNIYKSFEILGNQNLDLAMLIVAATKLK
jgi:hypothetical protein